MTISLIHTQFRFTSVAFGLLNGNLLNREAGGILSGVTFTSPNLAELPNLRTITLQKCAAVPRRNVNPGSPFRGGSVGGEVHLPESRGAPGDGANP